MTDNFKRIHKAYCNYEISKAKSARIMSVREERKPRGIKTANVSKAVLAMQLAELF